MAWFCLLSLYHLELKSYDNKIYKAQEILYGPK